MEEYKDKLFHGVNLKLFEFSKALRKNQTEAEEIMWQCLRNRKILNFKFRRQHPVHQFIADFYCHEAKLIIEIDGGIHNHHENQEYDQNRTDELKEIGITIIRFTNEDVNNNPNEVINVIKGYLSP
ncbi:endonuclease domain-containing protein [Pedobacter kyonggii]|uniref:Endonuclease domain-containing protein n=1 Tax=Pedobacter kyonggii TaxID=1926871 RepID=A0A4Q9HG37_9SPHI|nr:endonuclease domain-containing protein [Pedobacter kyonggii]TBO44059.1 endonuclease domain-containing protein [Pedobacter kyonggii]